MPVEASVGELQKLAQEKIDGLYQQIADKQDELNKVLASVKEATASAAALEQQRTALQAQLQSLSDQIASAQTTLTESQAATLTRLEAAATKADEAAAAADKKQRDLEITQGKLHTLRERVRGVILDALQASNETLTQQTKKHGEVTTALDELLKLVTVDSTEVATDPAPSTP